MSVTTVYLLYLVFVAGGAALHFAMPRPHKSNAGVAALLGVAALVGLLTLFQTRLLDPGDTTPYFYLFSSIAVLAAARVITHTRPVYSALYFVVVVIAVAALLVLQSAEFLAIALIIVYAGAILVTYLFVIMLAQQPGSPVYDRRAREPFLAVLVGFVLTGAIAGRAGDLPTPPPTIATSETFADGDAGAEAFGEGNVAKIGSVVMTKYVVALEIAGVLLLVSMVGAIALSRKKVASEGFRAPPRPLGQIGREVEPF